MDNNLTCIARIIAYIEAHLEEKLDLDSIAREAGYSKYHVHRMFTGVVGLTIHAYVQRRRLTEAARRLVFTDQPIMDIALLAGYETRQSFSVACRAQLGDSPRALRRKRAFCPLQLAFTVDGIRRLRGDRIMDIEIVESGKILLVGYMASTKRGFGAIGRCMAKFLANRDRITGCVAGDCVIAVNDYSRGSDFDKAQPAFDFYAAMEALNFAAVPRGMVTRELPASRYVVFHFSGRPQDSMQPVAAYIYNEWFPQSTCRLNEKAMLDFTKSYDAIGPDGNSKIEYWVPIL